MRAEHAATAYATMALRNMPRIPIVQAVVYLTLSFCTFTVPIHAAASRGINEAAAGINVPRGAGGTRSGVPRRGQGYNNTQKGNGGSVLTPPGQNSSPNMLVPGRWTSPRRGSPVNRAGEFLRAHNKVRASVNVPPFKWDNALARYTRRFAAKRAVDCKMLHAYGPYGENIFWAEKDEWTPTKVVESWVSENQYYDKVNNKCEAGQMCGHYTQVVWIDSTRIGCAMVTCRNGGMYTMCIYDPPGNFVNESPFKPYKGGQ